RRRGLAAVAARRHVMERRGRQLVELRRGEADAGALRRDHARPEADEQWRRQASAAVLRGAAVDDDDGAAVGIGVEGDVGHAAGGVAGILADAHLPTRDGFKGAGAAAGAGPYRLALPGRGRGIERGAAD